MHVLFIGNTQENIGPDNVNKKLIKHWRSGEQIETVHARGYALKALETLYKGLASDIIISASSKRSNIAVSRILMACGKPLVCFNHGYVPFENEINNLGYSQERISVYRHYLDRADLVVANSRYQMEHLQQMQPSLKGRLAYVNNAVEPFEQHVRGLHSERGIAVAVSGGTRPIKGNEVVAEAVCSLVARGEECTLSVYGNTYSPNERLEKAMTKLGTQLEGQVSQDRFCEGLRRCDIFVMNSRHESFGLSVLDALKEGASILVSDNCGVAGVLELEETDRIHDCEDPEEVAEKITYLATHSNSKRIYSAIDFANFNWGNTSAELYKLTRGVLECHEKRRPRPHGSD